MNEETEINPTEDGEVEQAAPETPPGVEPEILSSPPPPGVEPEILSSPLPPVATPEAAEVEMQTAVSVEQIQSEATQPLPPKAEKSKHRHKRISLFFPLLLIFIGVVFLLRNFGYINADTWDLFNQPVAGDIHRPGFRCNLARRGHHRSDIQPGNWCGFSARQLRSPGNEPVDGIDYALAGVVDRHWI